MSQVTTRRNSVSQRRRAQILVFAGLGLALAGLAWLAMAGAMLQLQAARCPADTFFCASDQIATAVQIVPLFLPALGVGFLIATWLDASLPAGLIRSRETGRPSGRRAGDQAQMVKLSLILLALILPISFGASLSQFCLGARAIAYQAAPWSGFRTYEWEEVASVTATCSYRRGRYPGWTKQLIVTMRDGAAFDLMSWPSATARAYPAIAGALSGHDVSFDAKGVAPRCPEPYLGTMTRHP
jgi:hypothetical protein